MQKVHLLVLIVTASISFAVPLMEQEKEYGYSRYILMPDEGGVMHTVDLEAEPNMALLDEISTDPANNLYLLYTRTGMYRLDTGIIYPY